MKLQVPVGVFVTDHDTLYVCGGGEHREIELPVAPFRFRESRHSGGEVVTLIGQPGEQQQTRIYKQELESIPMKDVYKGEVFAPDIDYILDLVREHPNKINEMIDGDGIEPYPQFMDIETWGSTGNAFNPMVAEIVAIQSKYPDEECQVFHRLDFPDERDLIVRYIEETMQSKSGKHPDFIVGYNCDRFDAMFIHTRVRELNLQSELDRLARVTRGEKSSWKSGGIFYPWWMRGNDRELMHLYPGLMLLDLFKQVKIDQAKKVKQLQSKKLEMVAEAYGMPTPFDLALSEKKNMMGLLRDNTERFLEYSISDIVKTEYLYDIYKNRLIASANLLSVPMMMIHHMSPGQQSNVALYRECRKNRYFSLSKNRERYDQFMESGKYQGATVRCLKQGKFSPTIYVDAKSMYPNIMYDFNVSYDRYVVTDIIPYDMWDEEKNGPPNEIRAEGPQHARIVYIPDDNWKVIFKFQFNFRDPGFMKKMIKKYNDYRDEFKTNMKDAAKKYKETGDEKYKNEETMWDSMQQAAKIINNTFYGLQGDPNATFGDMAAGVFITALGRWQMDQMMDIAGDSLLEVDTDGILVQKNMFDHDITWVNEEIRRRMVSLFDIPESDDIKFELEFEGEGSIFLYKMKTYILHTVADNKLTIKGSAFTGYGKAKVLHRAIQIMAQTVMFGEWEGQKLTIDQAREICLDIRNLPIENFRFSFSVKRTLEDYKGVKGNLLSLSRAIDRNVPESQQIKSRKKIASDWLQRTMKDEGDRKRFKALVRSCKTEGQLDTVLSQITAITSAASGINVKKSYFVLDLLIRRIELDLPVNIDDEVTYFHTKTAKKESLEEDLQIETLDYERYYNEIHKILDRFEAAREEDDLVL